MNGSAGLASSRVLKYGATMDKTTPGPIARKLIAQIGSQRDANVINLAAVRAGREAVASLTAELAADRGLPPTLDVYTRVHNAAMAILEQVKEHPALRKLVGKIQKAEDEYMPSGPPMSPLTGAFFWAWALWDLGVGAPQETFGAILVALGEALGMEAGFLGVLRALSTSRLGIHGHDGQDGDLLLLTEPSLGVQQRCERGSGYRGERGQLLLTRVLPPLVAGGPSVLWGTPYQLLWPSGADWAAYFRRSRPKTGLDGIPAYERLMKRGLSPRYWTEYVFEAYANHEEGVIFLRGLPDVEDSRPHSGANADRTPGDAQKAAQAAMAALSTPKAPANLPATKISETLLEFAAPLLRDLPLKATPAHMDAALKLPWMVWNAMVLDDADGTGSKHLDEVRRAIATLPPAVAALEELVRLRRARFAHDPRLIGEVTVLEDSDGGGMTVRADARLPGAKRR